MKYNLLGYSCKFLLSRLQGKSRKNWERSGQKLFSDLSPLKMGIIVNTILEETCINQFSDTNMLI